MSIIVPCLGSGDGTKYTETVLWTNPSPTSDFAAQTVTLSESIENYKYIAVNYNYSTTNYTEEYRFRVIMPVDTFKYAIYPESTYTPSLMLGVYNTNATARRVYYQSNTQVRFGSATTVGNTTTTNNRSIPTEIIGLNTLSDEAEYIEDTLWANPSPTSAYAGGTVNLNNDMSGYDFLAFDFAFNISSSSTPASCGRFLVQVSEFKKAKGSSSTPLYYYGGCGSTVSYSRAVRYSSNTTIVISTAYQLASSTANNNACIPTKITGIKYIGKSEEFEQTSLWVNSSPTSSFADTTITLSQSIDNFKYICIRTRYGTTTEPTSDNIYSVEDLKKSVTTAINHVNATIGIRSSAGVMYSRLVFYISDISLRINNNYRLNTAETANGLNIPLEIFGLNELEHGKKFDETVLWTNSAPTATFAAQTIILNDDINNYDYIKISARWNTSTATEQTMLCYVPEFKTYNESEDFWFPLSLYTSSYYYTRNCRYASDTSILFNSAFRYNSSSGSQANSTVVPTSIVGCKFA